jgi:hypothetical protein
MFNSSVYVAVHDNPIDTLSPASTGMMFDVGADYEAADGFAMNELLTTMAADAAPFEPADATWQMPSATESGLQEEFSSFMGPELTPLTMMEEATSS